MHPITTTKSNEKTNVTNVIVVKRNGTKEPFTPEKIHKPLNWASQGLKHFSISAIEMTLVNLLIGKVEISSDDLHEMLISATANNINEQYIDHDVMAGRLITYQVRKHAYGSYTPPKLIDIVKRNIAIRRYDKDIINYYSEAEWEELNNYIDHTRDDSFKYSGAEQMRKKYLAKDRVTKDICESFQLPYILVPAILFHKEARSKRMQMVKDGYDILSLKYWSLPTPIMAGLRTRKKQFSSCVVIDAGDTLASINAADSAATLYVANKAGLGINVGRNRGLGASINDGDAYHTGVIPFIKKLTGSVKSCSQGGVRDGAVTFFFPMWHMEYEELVVLKDNSLPEGATNKSADYCVQINKYLLNRLIQGKDITLFSPGENETPGLYEAFFNADQTLFGVLYEKYEADPSVRKKVIPATKAFNTLAIQRSSTGRIYIMFADLVNQNTMFKDKIYQSNLCMEILLPTLFMKSLEDTQDSEISLCTLSAVNMGLITKPSDFERIANIGVRMLDNVLDYQDYPVAAARKSTLGRRPLGIGIIDFAHFLAQRGLWYGEVCMSAVDEYMEAFAYYLTRASVDLAIEKGPCPMFERTKYADGWTPNLNRNAYRDSILTHKERLPWTRLREDMKKHGIRNSTLMAFMPSETSAQLSGSTNGFEPPKGPIVTKDSKDGKFVNVVPEYHEYNATYDYVWKQKTPEGYLKMSSVCQKYNDQGGSWNTSYNPSNFPDEKVTTKQILGDILLAYKLGLPTLYYNNTRKPGEDDFVEEDGCSDGACKI